MTLNDEQQAQRERALADLREALERVRTAEAEVRRWAPLSIMNSFVAVQAELQTILARI